MKHLLLTTIAAVVLVGCGESQSTVNAPDISLIEAAAKGNIEAVKQHLAAGADVNAKDYRGGTPLQFAVGRGRKDIIELLIAKCADVNVKSYGTTPLDMAYDSAELADLIRKHGGKTGEELKAEGK